MKERYALLDSIRGITLLSMILYHGMFDLVEIYGVKVPWFWDTSAISGSRASVGPLFSCPVSAGILEEDT